MFVTLTMITMTVLHYSALPAGVSGSKAPQDPAAYNFPGLGTWLTACVHEKLERLVPRVHSGL